MIVSKVEFERSVHRGLGRAIQWLLNGEAVADRNFLLYACTHNLAYDRQTENTRALHMFDIIQATSEPEFYARAVECSLEEAVTSEDEEDDRSIGQMLDLLGLLAKSGDTSARQSLYLFFEKPAAKLDGFDAEVLLDIDGLAGYLFIIQQWLRQPQLEDDQRFDRHLLQEAEERFGAEKTRLFFEQAAQVEPPVGAYIAEVREKQVAWHKRRGDRPKRHRPDRAEIREAIFDAKKRYGPMVWARYGEHLPAADAD